MVKPMAKFKYHMNTGFRHGFKNVIFSKFFFGFVTSLSMIISSHDKAGRVKDNLDARFNEQEDTFDFIVVGGGSAGSIVANRLSENHKVLLLEAGGEPHPLQRIPGMAFFMLNHRETDWMHRTVPQRRACFASPSRRSGWSQGRNLGGSGNLNFMVHLRGSPRDYDHWAKVTGDESWNYAGVLPYFRRHENYQGDSPDREAHGFDGELKLEVPSYTGMAKEFIRAGQELGYEHVDLNARYEEGFDTIYCPMEGGERKSSFAAFLDPIRERHTLVIRKYAHVNKILIRGFDNTAFGVEYDRHGLKRYAYATKEVIIAAGTVETAKLLMLSGIGPKTHLADLGIPLVASLPVGKNLQDHLATFLGPFFIDPPRSYLIDRDITLKSFYEYKSDGNGPLSSSLFQAAAMISSKHAKSAGVWNWPDIQLLMSGMAGHKTFAHDMSHAFHLNYKTIKKYYDHALGRDSFFISVSASRPLGRGEIVLESKDPYAPTSINPRYLENDHDLHIMIEGIKTAMYLVENTTSFQNLRARFTSKKFPGCEHMAFRSDDYFECYVRHFSVSMNDPVGTCAMGNPHMGMDGVLDSQLQVFGVHHLRVIDASVMPTIVGSQTEAAVMMIAEKGADMIIEAWRTREPGENNNNDHNHKKPFVPQSFMGHTPPAGHHDSGPPDNNYGPPNPNYVPPSDNTNNHNNNEYYGPPFQKHPGDESGYSPGNGGYTNYGPPSNTEQPPNSSPFGGYGDGLPNKNSGYYGPPPPPNNIGGPPSETYYGPPPPVGGNNNNNNGGGSLIVSDYYGPPPPNTNGPQHQQPNYGSPDVYTGPPPPLSHIPVPQYSSPVIGNNINGQTGDFNNAPNRNFDNINHLNNNNNPGGYSSADALLTPPAIENTLYDRPVNNGNSDPRHIPGLADDNEMTTTETVPVILPFGKDPPEENAPSDKDNFLETSTNSPRSGDFNDDDNDVLTTSESSRAASTIDFETNYVPLAFQQDDYNTNSNNNNNKNKPSRFDEESSSTENKTTSSSTKSITTTTKSKSTTRTSYNASRPDVTLLNHDTKMRPGVQISNPFPDMYYASESANIAASDPNEFKLKYPITSTVEYPNKVPNPPELGPVYFRNPEYTTRKPFLVGNATRDIPGPEDPPGYNAAITAAARITALSNVPEYKPYNDKNRRPHDGNDLLQPFVVFKSNGASNKIPTTANVPNPYYTMKDQSSKDASQKSESAKPTSNIAQEIMPKPIGMPSPYWTNASPRPQLKGEGSKVGGYSTISNEKTPNSFILSTPNPYWTNASPGPLMAKDNNYRSKTALSVKKQKKPREKISGFRRKPKSNSDFEENPVNMENPVDIENPGNTTTTKKPKPIGRIIRIKNPINWATTTEAPLKAPDSDGSDLDLESPLESMTPSTTSPTTATTSKPTTRKMRVRIKLKNRPEEISDISEPESANDHPYFAPTTSSPFSMLTRLNVKSKSKGEQGAKPVVQLNEISNSPVTITPRPLLSVTIWPDDDEDEKEPLRISNSKRASPLEDQYLTESGINSNVDLKSPRGSNGFLNFRKGESFYKNNQNDQISQPTESPNSLLPSRGGEMISAFGGNSGEAYLQNQELIPDNLKVETHNLNQYHYFSTTSPPFTQNTGQWGNNNFETSTVSRFVTQVPEFNPRQTSTSTPSRFVTQVPEFNYGQTSTSTPSRFVTQVPEFIAQDSPNAFVRPPYHIDQNDPATFDHGNNHHKPDVGNQGPLYGQRKKLHEALPWIPSLRLNPLPSNDDRGFSSIIKTRYAEDANSFKEVMQPNSGDIRVTTPVNQYGPNAFDESPLAFDQTIAPPLSSSTYDQTTSPLADLGSTFDYETTTAANSGSTYNARPNKRFRNSKSKQFRQDFRNSKFKSTPRPFETNLDSPINNKRNSNQNSLSFQNGQNFQSQRPSVYENSNRNNDVDVRNNNSQNIENNYRNSSANLAVSKNDVNDSQGESQNFHGNLQHFDQNSNQNNNFEVGQISESFGFNSGNEFGSNIQQQNNNQNEIRNPTSQPEQIRYPIFQDNNFQTQNNQNSNNQHFDQPSQNRFNQNSNNDFDQNSNSNFNHHSNNTFNQHSQNNFSQNSNHHFDQNSQNNFDQNLQNYFDQNSNNNFNQNSQNNFDQNSQNHFNSNLKNYENSNIQNVNNFNKNSNELKPNSNNLNQNRNNFDQNSNFNQNSNDFKQNSDNLNGNLNNFNQNSNNFNQNSNNFNQNSNNFNQNLNNFDQNSNNHPNSLNSSPQQTLNNASPTSNNFEHPNFGNDPTHNTNQQEPQQNGQSNFQSNTRDFESHPGPIPPYFGEDKPFTLTENTGIDTGKVSLTYEDTGSISLLDQPVINNPDDPKSVNQSIDVSQIDITHQNSNIQHDFNNEHRNFDSNQNNQNHPNSNTNGLFANPNFDGLLTNQNHFGQSSPSPSSSTSPRPLVFGSRLNQNRNRDPFSDFGEPSITPDTVEFTEAPQNFGIGSQRPDFVSQRPNVVSQRPNFVSQGPDFVSQRPDFGPLGSNLNNNFQHFENTERPPSSSSQQPIETFNSQGFGSHFDATNQPPRNPYVTGPPSFPPHTNLNNNINNNNKQEYTIFSNPDSIDITSSDDNEFPNRFTHLKRRADILQQRRRKRRRNFLKVFGSGGRRSSSNEEDDMDMDDEDGPPPFRRRPYRNRRPHSRRHPRQRNRIDQTPFGQRRSSSVEDEDEFSDEEEIANKSREIIKSLTGLDEPVIRETGRNFSTKSSTQVRSPDIFPRNVGQSSINNYNNNKNPISQNNVTPSSRPELVTNHPTVSVPSFLGSLKSDLTAVAEKTHETLPPPPPNLMETTG